jgi:protein SCO1/2
MVLIISCGLICHVQAQTGGRNKIAAAPAAGKLIEIDNIQILLPDTEVLNHEGKLVHFYSDLVKDKVVLLSFFYTSCRYVCLRQGESLSKVQEQLGARLGKDMFLISISMDPQTDTPQKLKSWGKAFGARPGWTLVSSKAPEIERLLKALTGNDPGQKEMHSSLVFLGNDRTGAWLTTDGLLDPGSLVKLLEGLMNQDDAQRRPVKSVRILSR